jgi:DNA-directed RNA polymerase subunit RPC12/RpoP
MSNLASLKPHNQLRYVCVGCGHDEQMIITIGGDRLKKCPKCEFTAMLPSDAEPLELLQTRLNFVTITSDQVITTLREVIKSKNEEIKVLSALLEEDGKEVPKSD